MTQKIRWLIAHEPVDLFLRTAKAFAEHLAESTDGAFTVEIYTPTEYEEKMKSTRDSAVGSLTDPMIEMEAGRLEMSQMHITELAKWHSPEFLALELPFLFRDHDHAARVLEGEIGQKMLSELADKSPAKGLAFTYSGGFKVVASTEQLTKLSDFKGHTFAVNLNPIGQDVVDLWEGTANTFSIRDFVQHVNAEGSTSDALVTTIPRFVSQFQASNKKYILNTKHSLFLTSVIVSNQFWDSLDKDIQDKIIASCLYASRLERKWSVEEADEFANASVHGPMGVTYTEMTAEETAKFKELVQPIYAKYKDFFYPGLVDGIIQS
jgi:TRAP-type C4-dicarboxylate transport system substrate-binding protein